MSYNMVIMGDIIANNWVVGQFDFASGTMKVEESWKEIGAARYVGLCVSSLANGSGTRILPTSSHNYTITRYLEKHGEDYKQVMEVKLPNSQNEYDKRFNYSQTPYDSYTRALKKTILIISDYGKCPGGILTQYQNMSDDPYIVVIDSKHRTVPAKLLTQFRCNNVPIIWRCTGDEYKKKWAEDNSIQYVVHTNHEGDIDILDIKDPSNNKTISTHHQKADPLLTMGCGDLFTATIGVAFKDNTFSFQGLVRAATTANELCQHKIASGIPGCTYLPPKVY